MHAWDVDAKSDWPSGVPADQRHHYDLVTIRKWLEVFLRRFFAFSLFKRSAMPNGPKVSLQAVRYHLEAIGGSFRRECGCMARRS
jgi:hypothetical protein